MKVPIAIQVFLSAWNDFVGPLLNPKSPDLFFVPTGLAQLCGLIRSRLDLWMAAATALTVRVAALFFAAHLLL